MSNDLHPPSSTFMEDESEMKELSIQGYDLITLVSGRKEFSLERSQSNSLYSSVSLQEKIFKRR